MSKDIDIDKLKNEIVQQFAELGLIDSEIYLKLSNHAKQSKENVFDLCLNDGLLDFDEFVNNLHQKIGIEIERNASLVKDIDKSFPLDYCKVNNLAVISIDDAKTKVGICIPGSLAAVKNLSLLSGKKISTCIVSPELLFNFLGHKIVIPQKKLTQDPSGEESKSNQGDVSKHASIPLESQASISGNDNKAESINLNELKKDIDDENKKVAKIALSGDVVAAVDEVLTEAIETGVSDIHIEIFKDTANIRFRNSGTLITKEEYRKFINDNYNAVIARIKILANLDIAERRLPQDGKISYTSKKGTQVDFRVSVLPTNLGERIVIRILNSTSLALDVEKLGFSEAQLKQFMKAIEAPQGMVLVTGPTGSGKSTTLYGAINHLNKPDVNVMTAEDPVEYTLSGIAQVQVRDDIGLTFASALRSFLRQDPEIILVGEIRDTETADIATKAALTGHLVLSTLHTNSCIGAISRLSNMGLPNYLISSAVTLIVAQRLVRKNCPDCRKEQEYHSDEYAELIKSYPKLKDVTFYHGAGCKTCDGTGIKGRFAVHEVLSINNKLQAAINKNKSDNELYEIATKDGFLNMQDSAIRHIHQGDLSVEEFLGAIPTTDLTQSDDEGI